jgi:hypothetical protein
VVLRNKPPIYLNSSFLLLFFFSVLGFELRAYTSSHSTNPFFVMDFFEIESCKLFPQGWLWTVILLISASLIARTIRVSDQHLAFLHLFKLPPNSTFPVWPTVAIPLKITSSLQILITFNFLYFSTNYF